jgi:CRISPR-associated protein Cas1
MPTACILQSDCHIRLKSERLEVWGRNSASGSEEILREIPIRDVERLIFVESVQITSAALAALLRANIPVNVLGWSGQFLGGFLPATNAHGLARLRQYQRTIDPAFTLQMAGRIITAKLYNQRRVLQRLASARQYAAQPSDSAGSGGIPVDAAEGALPAGLSTPPERLPIEGRNPKSEQTLAWLDGLFASISRSQTLDELRGYEGAATARYFQTWAEFLPAEFPFERRSTRPPLNAVNACISFGSTLVYHEAVAFIHAHGLDPALGLLHHTEDGRWSLALDLIEPFRPALVEALALDLFSHQMLEEKNFEPKNGGVYLNDPGRKKFILQYERRMERQFMSECAGHRTSLRQQLENQAVMFKAALEAPDKFEPFLMN